MSALDDALNSSSVVFDQAEIIVDWAESPVGYSANPDPNNLRKLGSQIGPDGMQISQSLDDGLPDPVTMTTGVDASGVLESDLVGRGALVADEIGWRTNSPSGLGTGTLINTQVPSDATYGDYTIVAVSINSVTATITQLRPDYNNPNRWRLLGVYQDNGSGLKLTTQVWGRPYGGTSTLSVSVDVSVAYTWISVAAYARTANGSAVPYYVGTPVGVDETVSGTSHNAPTVTLARRGWTVGVFSLFSASANWTPGTGTTEINEAFGGTIDVMISRSFAIRDPGNYTYGATSGFATATATMVMIPLELGDAGPMDAGAFFSPFNSSSPVYGYDRDTAAVSAEFNIITEEGPVATTLFTGQMADLPITTRTSQLQAISKTRMWLSRTVTLPTIWGTIENCDTDWVALYLLARGSQYVGSAPNKSTVYWAPMYGSVHHFFGHENTYTYGYRHTNPAGSPLRPIGITDDGPFFKGAYACQNAIECQEIISQIVVNQGTEVFPHLEEAYQNGEMFKEQLTQQNSKGRISFWVRGDAIVNSPDYFLGDTARDYCMYYQLRMLNSAGTILVGLVCGINASRVPYISMGTSAGYTQFLATNPAMVIPTDGGWHFVSFVYDYANSDAGICMDGIVQSSTTFAGVVPSALPISEAVNDAAGGTTWNFLRSHVPISDVIVDAGPDTYDLTWAEFWPSPAMPGQNMMYRGMNRPLTTVVEALPVNAWDTLAEIARESQVAYRIDEYDQVNWMPTSYFGEAFQMTPETITIDTAVNAGDIEVFVDPSKIRNVVTVAFPETRIDDRWSSVLVLNTAIALAKGKTTLTFALDISTAEIHGAGDQTVVWKMGKITTSQIANPALIPTGLQYVSINSKEDGTGTVYTSDNDFTATIVDATVSTVTITFNNKRNQILYLANNGDQVPFMRVLGYAVRQNDAYVTVRNTDPFLARRERSLEVSVHWIHDRTRAIEYGTDLLATLSLPRPELTVPVMGDPRRKPGQLITLQDTDGTKVQGTWRILAVDHDINGAKFVQKLKLVNVGSVMIWDNLQTVWDYSVWGE